MTLPFLRNAWYVAAWSSDVAPGQILPRTIMGEHIVVYRGDNGSAAALADRCPHRFAPLRLGRVTGSALACGYHGLEFEGSGRCVRNPHGDGTIPAKAAVRTYPLLERNSVLCIWPGTPALATTSPPDYPYLDAEGHRTVRGSAVVKGGYELFNDNLMDASHTQYVHMDLLGTNMFAEGQHEVVRDGRFLHSRYLIRGTTIPTAWQPYFRDPAQRVDYSIDFRWEPASLVRNTVQLTPAGPSDDLAMQRIGSHFMTPETETSTHYFFAHTRNFKLDDGQMDEVSRRWQQSGLIEQDGRMIEAVQATMGTSDLYSLGPTFFSIDTAATRVHHVLAETIARERSELLA